MSWSSSEKIQWINFYDPGLKAETNYKKYWTPLKWKNFCFSESTNYWENEKTNHGLGENICNYIYDKGLKPKYIKISQNSIIRKEIIQFQNRQNIWSLNLKWANYKEDTQIASKHINRCTISLNIRKMQIEPQWDPTTHSLDWPK